MMAFFTNRSAKWNPDLKILELEISPDTLYDCLTRNYDKTFNFLQTPNIVSTPYNDSPQYEFVVRGNPAFTTPPDLPFFGSFISDVGGLNPYFGAGAYGREVVTTYCQGGQLQKPEGAGWEVLVDGCEAKGVTTWYRKPPIFTNTLPNSGLLFKPPVVGRAVFHLIHLLQVGEDWISDRFFW